MTQTMDGFDWWDDPEMATDADAALVRLVEADRARPDLPFNIARSHDSPSPSVVHAGLVGGLKIRDTDLFELIRANRIEWISYKRVGFHLTLGGHQRYVELQAAAATQLESVDSRPMSFVNGSWFRENFNAAHGKWMAAAAFAAAHNDPNGPSMVGHLAREGMQEFADALVRHLELQGQVGPDKAKTVLRLKAVLDHYRPNVGDARARLLDALLAYWGTTVDLVQRQEHAGQREGEPLGSRDSQRVVFHTAVVFHELAELMGKGPPTD